MAVHSSFWCGLHFRIRGLAGEGSDLRFETKNAASARLFSAANANVLAVVGVLALRCRNRRIHLHLSSGEHPGLLAGGEPRRQHAVIDFTSYGKPVELRRRDEESLVVFKSIRRSVDVAFRR